MHDSTRSVQKKKEQLNASKRLLEEQEDEIMVNVGILWNGMEFLYHVYKESGFFFRSYRCYVRVLASPYTVRLTDSSQLK